MAAEGLDVQKLSAWLSSQGAERAIPDSLRSLQLAPLWSFLGFSKADERARADKYKSSVSKSDISLFPGNAASRDLRAAKASDSHCAVDHLTWQYCQRSHSIIRKDLLCRARLMKWSCRRPSGSKSLMTRIRRYHLLSNTAAPSFIVGLAVLLIIVMWTGTCRHWPRQRVWSICSSWIWCCAGSSNRLRAKRNTFMRF